MKLNKLNKIIIDQHTILRLLCFTNTFSKTTNVPLDGFLGAVVEVGDLATAGREGGLAEHAVLLIHRPFSALLNRIDKGLDSSG